MKITARILFILLLADFVTSSAHADLTKGIEDFEKHRWAASMGEFIDVLQHDPRNVQAHEYLALAAHELEAERAAVTRDKRLEMLSNASQLMEDNHQDSNPLQSAINETKTAEDKARADRAHTQCVMAEMEDRRGDLAAANDYVLRVLQDDPANAEAQRKLSDLQSELRQTLTTGSLTEAQRALFEGFYAFGQSDYRSAALAWAKARAALSDNSPDTNAQARAHFEPYAQISQRHVDEEDRAQLARAHFESGVDFFQKGSVAQALESFRQVALINPEYPQLGSYLAQSEAAAERERTRRLGSDKHQRADEAFAKGLAALEQGDYEGARRSFRKALDIDPSNDRARTYLAQSDAQRDRHPDPNAAQAHYEAGLIAYAGGHEDEAVREWHIALRLDPDNEKSQLALNKLHRENKLSEELP